MKNDPNTIYILSLTGGGAKGYLSNKFLKRFYERWRLSRGQTEEEFGQVWQNFDVIGGTSVGSIGATAYGLGKNIDEVLDIFQNEAPWIFTTRTTSDVIHRSCNASVPSNKAGKTDKIVFVTENHQLYRSFCDTCPADGTNNGKNGCSNYGHVRLRSVLRNSSKVTITGEVLGIPYTALVDATMQDMKTNVVVPVYCNSIGRPVIFSNIASPEYEGNNFKAYEVAMSSSAAPVYLPPYVIEGREYIDGGIYQNSASQIAITAGNYLKKKATRVCIVEITTGLDLKPHTQEEVTPVLTAVSTLLNFISDSIGAVQANTARDLRIRNKYTLEEINYYSYAPILNPPIGVSTELDDTAPATLAYYDSLVEEAFVPGSELLRDIDDMIVRLNA